MKTLLLLASCLVTSALAETPVLQARMSSTSFTACWRAQNAYEIDMEGKLEIENTSSKTILVVKKVDMVRTITASLSAEEANRGMHSLVMNQEFGGRLDKEPRLDDFIAIKPGEKETVELGAVVPANTDPSYSGKDRLRLGKNWVQFSFYTIPLSFPNGRKFDSLKNKWKSRGMLLNGYFATQPFLVNVSPDANAPRCN